VALDLDELVSAIQLGDADAFAQWLARAEAPLRASLAPFATRVDVEAILQDTMLRVWQIVSRFRPDGRANGLLRLARRIGTNLALDAVRRERGISAEIAEIERSLAEQNGDTVVPEPDPFVQRAIQTCHDALPDKPRLALGARILDGGREPDRTLAERLRMTTNTFLQNVTRARRLMAACLESHGVDLQGLAR
jgi:RNA polymerase sigma-70 factor (ECF subfamily)